VLPSEYAQKSAFARAVCTDQQNSTAALYADGNVAEHGRQLVFVNLRRVLVYITFVQLILQNKMQVARQRGATS
jgi:hypothetical protein